MQPEIQGAIIGSITTLLGGYVMIWFQKRQTRHDQVQNLVLMLREARFALVGSLLDAAHSEGREREAFLKQARTEYRDLSLVVEKYVQLEQDECLRKATQRFRTRIMNPARDPMFRGSRMAREIRLATQNFNQCLDTILPSSSFDSSP